MIMRMLLRRVAERLSRNRYFQRRLPRKFGRIPFFVSPDAALSYVKPGSAAFDEELLKIAEDFVKRESVVWDIGACIGVFTFAAAAKATQGTVVAVEADIWLAQLLRRSLRLKENVNLNVRVLPAAVSECQGVVAFQIAKRGRSSNAIEDCGTSQMGGIREKVDVPTLTLDSLLHYFPRPTLVKIDIEGAEVKALRGGMNLLREVRPIYYIEVAGNHAEEVTTLFKENDYLVLDGKTRRRIQTCTYNTLFLPEEASYAREIVEVNA